ncbi:MAG: type II toxin-antitoxin system VapC family toxin [Verrucomicrobia bacterium]|nr:type II toxin-antitoxin system VapC family toxin [Verrucomicrobiota bacterium]MDA1203180.1 type II toxin-antitoxin system VapC family toxin [Verrucomicrobiota bacterium]
MIIPDVNLLIYAHNRRDPHHEPAKIWWEDALSGNTPVGLPWVGSSGFIRIMTNRRVMTEPLANDRTIALVQSWLDQPNVIILEPGPKFTGLYFGYLGKLGTAGNLTTDAQLAALAVENQAELHSNDTDFTRFDGLRWRNPLK